METKIFLVRHAESAPNKNIPEPLWPLSELGKMQARELVPTLKRLGVKVIYSSPYPRAIDTVKEFGEECGLPINIENGFRERKLTNGMVDDFLSVLEKAWSDFDFKLQGCESSRECQERFVGSTQLIAEKHVGQKIAIASHGNAIGLFLNSIDPKFGFRDWKEISNPDIFEIEFRDGQFEWNKKFSWRDKEKK